MTDEKQQNKKTFIDYYRTKRTLEFIDRYDKEESWKRLNAGLQRKRLHRRLISVASVAAVFAVAFTCFYLLKNESEITQQVHLATQQEKTSIHKPEGVILSLADGRQVNLTQQEEAFSDGNIINDPENKQLSYTDGHNPNQTIHYNRLEVPQGTDYRLVLSDGSKVWLNARSRLTYPEVFGEIREIKLEGEAYFEVAHDEKRPFIVHTDNLSVKVLGTEFNINARRSERVQTVLVKGRVEVENAGKQKVILHPGELAESGNSRMEVSKVNVRKYTAWREGMFYFEETTLEEIMQELSDWYYVQTIFTNPTSRTRKFSGILKRNDSLEKVLKKIELTTSVHFTASEGIVKVE